MIEFGLWVPALVSIVVSEFAVWCAKKNDYTLGLIMWAAYPGSFLVMTPIVYIVRWELIP